MQRGPRGRGFNPSNDAAAARKRDKPGRGEAEKARARENASSPFKVARHSQGNKIISCASSANQRFIGLHRAATLFGIHTSDAAQAFYASFRIRHAAKLKFPLLPIPPRASTPLSRGNYPRREFIGPPNWFEMCFIFVGQAKSVS